MKIAENIRQTLRVTVLRLFAVLFPKSFLLDKRHFFYWEKQGYHISPVIFYSPLPDSQELTEENYRKKFDLQAININERGQLALLKQFRRKYYDRYSALPMVPTGVPSQYFLTNGAFNSVDGEILYCMIMHNLPKTIIEVGSGNTTYLMARAIAEMHKEKSHHCSLTSYDPYPNEIVRRGFSEFAVLRPMRIQDVERSAFEMLQRNDILFIDSSHVVKIGSDVQYLFTEVLPHLRKGVIVHFHDIFIPEEYLRRWFVEDHEFWNEQYMLYTFLQYNQAFKVLWAGNYMRLHHPELLMHSFPSYQRDTVVPGSFWIQKVA